MVSRAAFLVSLVVLAMGISSPTDVAAVHSCPLSDANIWSNNIPPRLQWDENQGYCGETSLISAGLYYGQYVSQYDARTIALCGAQQTDGQLLLGLNDQYAASMMHLNSIAWTPTSGQGPNDFLAWVKQNVVQGYPVAIGVYTNEYLFYGNTDPDAGDSEYDHIVTVTRVGSNHPLNDPNFYADDLLCFSDNGLWGNEYHPPFNFSYAFDTFQANRRKANTKKGSVYSLPKNVANYGIAITGVMDLNGDTYPVRVDTNINYERPEIVDGSNVRPAHEHIILTVSMSGLEPGVDYNLYRYNNFEAVPDSEFNAHASDAFAHWPIVLNAGSTYVMTLPIKSDEVAIFRLVKASAP